MKGLPAFLKTGFLRKEKNMKRMVKNGDLLDVEPDGTITVDGKSINAIEANPTDEATETLTKLKVGETT